MTGESYNASRDRDDLGELLVLLHGADVAANTIQVTYRVWRHQERLHAAFCANAQEQQRRGASTRTFSLGRGTPQPTEIEETVRIWRDGTRVRVEYHGGARDGYYAVADGPLWWMWDERNGAHSNQDDPSVGSGVGEELQIMRNPTPLLSSLRFQPTGSSEVAGRPTISARGIPRPQDARRGPPAFELHELGMAPTDRWSGASPPDADNSDPRRNLTSRHRRRRVTVSPTLVYETSPRRRPLRIDRRTLPSAAEGGVGSGGAQSHKGTISGRRALGQEAPHGVECRQTAVRDRSHPSHAESPARICRCLFRQPQKMQVGSLSIS